MDKITVELTKDMCTVIAMALDYITIPGNGSEKSDDQEQLMLELWTVFQFISQSVKFDDQ